MGIRGELFTNQVNLDNRSYYFNVKENRNGDIFLQVVESKIKEGEERRDIVIFADDMSEFFKGLDQALSFIDKTKKERAKIRAEKKAAKEAKFGAKEKPVTPAKKVYRRKGESRLVAEKKSEKKLHIVSKRTAREEY
ncbi:MAG: DUF3276 family protein [Treponema sp.]|nr:DUF3276 family protein [Spirochaetia bacterium]MDY4902613.1 DUF3276 family protein [Treponema sp.]